MATATTKAARRLVCAGQTWAQAARQRSTKAVEEACDVFENSFKIKTLSNSHYPDDVILQFRPPRVRFSHLPRGHLNFMLQDYLGLSTHPEIITAHQMALADLGTTGLVGHDEGAWTKQLELEERVARFHGRKASFTCVVPHAGLTGLLNSILTEADVAFYDQWTHPYLIEGISAWKSRKISYTHKNLSELESQLKTHSGRFKLIVTEGVFSRDCSIAPLRDLADLADENGALLIVDDSHGVGVLGDNLRGTEEHCGAIKRSFLLTSAMNAAFGQSLGSYTVGPKSVIECLRRVQRNNPHGLILPPALAATAVKALSMLPSMRPTVQNLHKASQNLAQQLKEVGFDVVETLHPVVQVKIGNDHTAGMLVDELFESGLLATLVSHPQVPKGDARVEITCTAHHTYGDIKRAFTALTEAGIRVGVIKSPKSSANSKSQLDGQQKTETTNIYMNDIDNAHLGPNSNHP